MTGPVMVCPECFAQVGKWHRPTCSKQGLKVMDGQALNLALSPVWNQPPLDGETFDAVRDGLRLGKQMRAVLRVLEDGKWHTLAEMSRKTGYPEASVSARLRDLRKEKFGAHDVERHFLKGGLWCYRLGRADES